MKNRKRDKKGKRTRIPVDKERIAARCRESWSVPTFYEDEIYKCVECGAEQVFTASQQKMWYEEEGKLIWQRPIRCFQHHEEWREKRTAKFAMDKAIQELKEFPDDTSTKIDLGLCIERFYRLTGKGNLHLAIHCLKSSIPHDSQKQKKQKIEQSLQFLRDELSTM